MAVEPEELPPLLTHMTIALFFKLGGSEKHKFLGGFEIARSQLVRWGYLTSGSFPAPISKIKLTAKGRRQNQKHKTEGAIKGVVFAALYRRWFKEDEDIKAAEKMAERKGGPPKGIDPTRVDRARKERRKKEEKKKSTLRQKPSERGIVAKKKAAAVKRGKPGAIKKIMKSQAAKVPKAKAAKKRMAAKVPKMRKAQKATRARRVKKVAKKKVVRKRGR